MAFFYQARGSLRDLGNFNEYFETGVTKRINYSDPRVDALWAQARASFDPDARKRVLSELQSVLLEDVPVHFLWRNKVLWGVSNSVDWTPRADETMLGLRDSRALVQNQATLSGLGHPHPARGKGILGDTPKPPP